MMRTILHSDLNCFFASVETALDPSLRGKAMAVCGSVDNRHGIVLAKSESAKRAGVQTAMVVWQAKQLCPGLIVVPPHFEQYVRYSKLVREIYARYTDLIEPFGMDECWLDVTGSRVIAGDGFAIAEKVRRAVREELDLTVSVGVSFNKVFAKLGSDLKKPDATTVIPPERFREIVWPLPIGSLLGAGPTSVRTLNAYGIQTIGDLALMSMPQAENLLGRQGLSLWFYANGLDEAPVMPEGYREAPKSIGHGVTCALDLTGPEEAWQVELALCQDVGHRLRREKLAARGIQLSVRDSELITKQFQSPLPFVTQSPLELARAAHALLLQGYHWARAVRSLTVTAIRLTSEARPMQLSLFEDDRKRVQRDKIDAAVERIRARHGSNAILPATIMRMGRYISGDIKETAMPR